MAYRYNIDASGGAFTALTIDGSCTPGERSLTIYAGPANNKWEEIIEDAAPDNDKLRLTASTNSSSSSRSGYGKIMYKINGNTCEAILHVVQEGGSGPDGKIKVQITLRNGVTSPYLSFKTANNTQVLGVPRFSINTAQTISISDGTCTKLGFSELGGGATRISITLQKQGNAPISLLSNANIPSSTATYLTLLNSFDTSNYNDSNTCTLSIDIG